MECLAGSIGVAYSDAEPRFILTAGKLFSCSVLAGSKAAKSFSFPSILWVYTNCITFSTGEHIVALYIGILTIEINSLQDQVFEFNLFDSLKFMETKILINISKETNTSFP